METKCIYDQSFDKVNFSEKPLIKGEYENCSFTNCDFSNPDLSEVIFLESEFSDCNFSNAGLGKTSLLDVTFNNCNMLGLIFDACNEVGFAATFRN